MLRPWPGNIRELRAEVRRSARDALIAGRKYVEATDLDETAGVGFSTDAPEKRVAKPPATMDKETIERALEREKGNVSRAARSLGLHRNQLYRLMERFAIEPKREPPP